MKTIIDWSWTEAFDKFGFEDGDGWNGTDLVISYLQREGYEVESSTWGPHNYMVDQITDKDGNDLINKNVRIGYDNPREYLPQPLVESLDKEFPENPMSVAAEEKGGEVQ